MTNIAILGYGNLGKGTELAVLNAKDMNLVGIFTRRDPESVKTVTGAKTFRAEDLYKMKDKIDVLIICGGSATDLPKQTPLYAKDFNVVDSFDTHAKIPEHFENVDNEAKENNKTAIISVGWDPGLFSIARLYASSVLSDGCDYTFWGKGVSQGHSDAIRRIDGVLNAKQYTIPKEEALSLVRSGQMPEFTARDKHLRECFVVAKPDADKEKIENEIKTMPNYFSDYDTIVHFITEDEFCKNHSGMAHGGFVIRNGKTGLNKENSHTIEYSLKLDSNPEFTASVLVCYARAIARLNKEGVYGCKTAFDIPPAYLSNLSGEELRKKLL